MCTVGKCVKRAQQFSGEAVLKGNTDSHIYIYEKITDARQKIMVGQLYLLLYLFYQAELFPDYKTQRLAMPQHIVLTT